MEKTAEAERKEELKKAKQEAAVKAAEEAKAALEPAKPVKEPDEIRFSRYGHHNSPINDECKHSQQNVCEPCERPHEKKQLVYSPTYVQVGLAEWIVRPFLML